MKQPRVPEYRESEGVQSYIKPLILFLKDFSMAAWTANSKRKHEIQNISRSIQEMPEIDYPVTSVNGKAGDVQLEAVDVGALGANEQAADAGRLGGVDAQEYALKADIPDAKEMYSNLADNTDFTHWVAQTGIGGKHGTQAYGGDRWILAAGTIAGEANTDGDGYSGVTLNGTLVQVVPSPPAVATPFIEMISGEAEISYDADAGEIVITSSGGVIRNVLLLEGEWTRKPEYAAKGYAAELAECLRYFERFGTHASAIIGTVVYVVSGAKAFICSLQYTPKRIESPTIVLSAASNYRVLLKDRATGDTKTATSVTSFDNLTAGGQCAYFKATLSGSTGSNYWALLQRSDATTGSYVDISADLARRSG